MVAGSNPVTPTNIFPEGLAESRAFYFAARVVSEHIVVHRQPLLREFPQGISREMFVQAPRGSMERRREATVGREAANPVTPTDEKA